MKKPILLLGLVLSTLLIATSVKANMVICVSIDIKPCSCPNSINPNSRGVVPVAILGSADFDVTAVDPPTVLFHGVSPLRWAWEDFNGDGYMDIIFHFKTQELVAADMTSSGEYTLIGTTFGGQPFQGSDWVNIVPPS